MRQHRVAINISGDNYETYNRTLRRYPDTLLGNHNKRLPFYCEQSNQYFFDRCRQCFGAILFFYQSNGILTCPPNMEMEYFINECYFFELPDGEITHMREKADVYKLGTTKAAHDGEGEAKTVEQKTHLWNILDSPATSFASWVFSLCSLAAIFVALIFACLETLPFLRWETKNLGENPWSISELILNTWFLIEFSLRLMASPKKNEFMTNPLNWVDGLAVIPFFFSIMFPSNKIKSLTFLRSFRFIIVMRLLRLSKQSKRLKVVSVILASSLAEFQLVMVCFAIIVILGASIMYYIEGFYSDTEEFSSIPAGLYWAVQTITTVGYGDMIPLTSLGRLVSSCFMIFGALTITLPVISLVTKFMTVYVSNTKGNRLVI